MEWDLCFIMCVDCDEIPIESDEEQLCDSYDESGM